MSENKYFAWCSNSECELKDFCVRFTEEECQPINFKAIMREDKCDWFIGKKAEVVKTEQTS